MRCANAAGATVAVSRMYYKLIVTGHTFVQPASIDIPTREYTTLWGLFLVLYLSVWNSKNEILNSTTTFGGGIYSRTVKVYSFI